MATVSGQLSIRDTSLYVEVVGNGYPLALMHGGPGADHWSMSSFRGLADQFRLVFYDHRCNGRSAGSPVSSMTWENLTADAEALRERLGFDRWAVLGHSFGGQVALEYALRYPDSLSHLILVDTGGSEWWPRDNAPRLLAGRGYRRSTVELVRRFYAGRIAPNEMLPAMLRFGRAYYYRGRGLRQLARAALRGEWRTKVRPEALVQGGRELSDGWSVMDRLGEITVPTLVIAGRDDFLFPPEHQVALADGLADGRLHIVERAGHNPHSERTAEVMAAVRDFVRPGATPAAVDARTAGPPRHRGAAPRRR
jgi:pimeloyl-ACP methyl ester carboxylesterase